MTTKLTRVFIFSFDYSRQYTFFFFFNDTATTEIYTLSLHDALPISIKVLELHHHGIRVGPTEADADRARTFYQDVLGLSPDPGRPYIPPIPGYWMDVGGRAQIPLMGVKRQTKFPQGPDTAPASAHVALGSGRRQ